MIDSIFCVVDLVGVGDVLCVGGECILIWIIKEVGNCCLLFDVECLQCSIDVVYVEFLQLDVIDYCCVVQVMVECKFSFSVDDLVDLLICEVELCVDLVVFEWEQFVVCIYLCCLYKCVSCNCFYDVSLKYGFYVGLQESLVDRGIYSNDILCCYLKEELQQVGEMIDLECDCLFVYNGLYLLVMCYLVSDCSCEVYELLQECWLIIVLYLMQEEKLCECCMQLVGEVYWVLFNLYMMVVMLILVNVGKVGGQLFSCFIDMVDDSLQGIYDFNIDIVCVFKYGGGVGVYLGYVCSSGVLICGVVNFFGGVVLWIKQFNNMVVLVDQFGQCKGVVVVYLDIWYCDIEVFMDLCFNNGDQCLCVYDVFILVCVFDLFMEVVECCVDWYLFDLYEVKQVKGWYLQDFYDEKCGLGSFCDCYVELVVDECISC